MIMMWTNLFHSLFLDEVTRFGCWVATLPIPPWYNSWPVAVVSCGVAGYYGVRAATFTHPKLRPEVIAWRRFVAGLGAILGLLAGPGGLIFVPLVSRFAVDNIDLMRKSPSLDLNVEYYRFFATAGVPTITHWWHWVGWLGGAVGGVGLWLALNRWMIAAAEKTKDKMRLKTSTVREGKTDIRTVGETLPAPTAAYDPLNYFKPGMIFVGLDQSIKPIYIIYDAFRKSHIQIVGTTGAGKGVSAGLLLVQAIQAGEAVVVMDPKCDEWAPHLMRQEAEKAGKPFVLIDLRAETPQLNIIAGASPADVEELLVAGLGLSDKGDAADHYRMHDRAAARQLSQILRVNPNATLADLAEAGQTDEQLAKSASGLVGRLAEIAVGGAVSAARGVDLGEVIKAGGVVYVIGSMRHGRILPLQRMLLVRLMQIIEKRDRLTCPPRQVCIFLDELKAHISKPAMEMLGAIRDKGAHLVLAHQSLPDLREVPADLDRDAVVGAVVENCAIRLAYRIQDPTTREWLAKMSGKILVDDETRIVETTAAFVEVQTGNRSLRQTEAYKISENAFAALPDRVAVVFFGTTTQYSHICPIITVKKPLQITMGEARPAQIVRAEPSQVAQAAQAEEDF
jgi:hypothetical protein